MSTEAIEKEMQDLGNLAVKYMRVALKDGGKNASGDLSKGLKADLTNTKDIIDIDIQIPEYGKYVDEGRKPRGKWSKGKKGFPNIVAIKDWVKTKPISLKGGVGIDSAVFLIGRGIFENGIKPFPFIQRSIEKAIEDSEDTIFNAMEEDTEFTIEESFKKSNVLKEK